MNQQEQEQILVDAYEIWKQNPITTLMFGVLAKHRDGFVSQLIAASSDSNVTDAQVRMLAYGLKTSHAIIQSLSTFETFKQHTNKK